MLLSRLPPHGLDRCCDAGTQRPRRSKGEAIQAALPKVRQSGRVAGEAAGAGGGHPLPPGRAANRPADGQVRILNNRSGRPNPGTPVTTRNV